MSFSSADYPADAVRLKEEGTVWARVLVAPSGRGERCDVAWSSGSQTLDIATCAFLLKRSRYEPARHSNGAKGYGLVDVPISWSLPDSPAGALRADVQHPDVVLFVNAWPDGRRPVADSIVTVEVDSDGKITSCIAAEKDRRASLAQLACSAPDAIAVERLVDAAGEPVRYVRNVIVHFNVDPSSAVQLEGNQAPLEQQEAEPILRSAPPLNP